MISLRGPKLKILAGILGAIALVAGIYPYLFSFPVFVTAMAFARSRALNDEGGSLGKQIRSEVRTRG